VAFNILAASLSCTRHACFTFVPAGRKLQDKGPQPIVDAPTIQKHLAGSGAEIVNLLLTTPSAMKQIRSESTRINSLIFDFAALPKNPATQNRLTGVFIASAGGETSAGFLRL
jgi:hypothetical protein